MTKHAFPLGRFATLTLAVTFALAVAVTIATIAVNHVHVTGPVNQTTAQETRGSNATTRTPDTRFDGGPEEGTRGTATAAAPSTRFDGGPEEGTRGGRR
jgi:outer membrane receptor protein involved in Fe transport